MIQRLFGIAAIFFAACILAGVLAPVGPAGAQGQALPDEINEMVGAWEISNADRDKICTVTLTADRAPHGLKLTFDPACAEAFEVTKDVSAWRLDKDGLHFVDAKGQALIDLD